MFKKILVYVILIVIAFLFAVSDFYINKYQRFFTDKTPVLINKTVISKQPVNNIITKNKDIPTTSDSEFIIQLENEFDNINIQNTQESNILFSRLDLSTFGLEYRYKTIITKDDQPFISFYELSGKEIIYFKLKDALDFVLKLSEEESLNPTNDFGSYSLYYNDDKRKNQAFLIILINDHLIGIEYLKHNHEEIKKILNLMENLNNNKENIIKDNIYIDNEHNIDDLVNY